MKKVYMLTWIYCGTVRILKESQQIELIQLEKSKLSKEPQYKKGKFEIRTKEGFKHKQILNT
jgi:hypothetical protein